MSGNTVNMLQYQTPIESFPYLWKRLLGEPKDVKSEFFSISKPARQVYTVLINNPFLIEEKIDKWETLLNITMEKETMYNQPVQKYIHDK